LWLNKESKMVLLRRRSVFAAKQETTVGTAEALTGTEGAFNARDFMIQPSVAMTRREGQGGFNYLASIPEGMQATCTIVHDLSYDGTNVPSWASVLLPACGWVDDGAGTFEPISRGPGSGGVKTLTLGHYKDGKRALISGAMGSFVLTLETGKVGYITFTFHRQVFDERNRHSNHCPDLSYGVATEICSGRIDVEQRQPLHVNASGRCGQYCGHA
jgi:hypothetical protein